MKFILGSILCSLVIRPGVRWSGGPCDPPASSFLYVDEMAQYFVTMYFIKHFFG
jgi:hypothetical protein